MHLLVCTYCFYSDGLWGLTQSGGKRGIERVDLTAMMKSSKTTFFSIFFKEYLSQTDVQNLHGLRDSLSCPRYIYILLLTVLYRGGMGGCNIAMVVRV